ncbi:MAG: hypothetical protein AAF329_05930, partial [Cyanobacteria bacterium P01_A01_bin.17]
MLEKGQIIPIQFKGRAFNAVVIDPDGLGSKRPTVGIGYRSMSRHTNVPAQTFVDRVSEIEGVNYLKLPSGKLFRVSEIEANDGNTYRVIEASDWVDLVSDWAKNPGRLRTKARNGLIDFLAWYAAEGLYAAAYTFLKQTYTREDNEIIQKWLVSREAGKPARSDWSYAIQDKGGTNPYKYGKWTNYIYRGLFSMDATEMKRLWENPVSGSRRVARNYIPESVGLDMVAYCEKLVSVLDFDDLEQAHDIAIQSTLTKFRR